MWPRLDGCYVYIPDDGTGDSDEPSDRFRRVGEQLRQIGVEASWSFNYNAGANPIGLAIPKEKLKDPILTEVLKESYDLA